MTWPLRRMVTVSARARVSLSLWVMMRMVLPLSLSRRSTLNRSVTSCRREHGRGLVQDEDLRLAVEGLEDLHALLGAHGEVLHLFPRVDVQAVFLGQGLHVRDGLFEVKAASLLRLVAEDHVLGHGHGLNEHEVLVHHGDAQLDGLERVFDLDGFALHADLCRWWAAYMP